MMTRDPLEKMSSAPSPKRRLVVLAFLLISGCSLTDTLAGGRVQGDEETAVVQADSAVYAAPLAVGHCSHYGLGAQFDHQLEPGRYLYRCVQSK